jgi:dUTP pyrophosphatase
MNINFKKLDENAITPIYGSTESAGADLHACLSQNVVIHPQEIVIIPTGIACEIPSGHFGMVCSRSGLAAKNGVVVLNSPGIIDADYRGELKLIMTNHSMVNFEVTQGMRLAQLIIVPFVAVNWTQRENLTQTVRNTGGIGSTGV